MIDGVSYKTITITDGIESPYINNTWYTISYPPKSYGVLTSQFKDVTLYTCYATISYSDGTTYTKSTEQPKVKIGDVKSISNRDIPQIKFTALDGVSDVYEIFKNVFPYITFQDAMKQTWSDGRTYNK